VTSQDEAVPTIAEISERMSRLGVVQEEVARALGRDQSTVSRWLSGERAIPVKRAAEVWAILDEMENPGALPEWPPGRIPVNLDPSFTERRRLTRAATRLDPALGGLLRLAERLTADQIAHLTREAAQLVAARGDHALAADGDHSGEPSTDRGALEARPRPPVEP
jgi:transcriptional regulator with XRE-family HTH domain